MNGRVSLCVTLLLFLRCSLCHSSCSTCWNSELPRSGKNPLAFHVGRRWLLEKGVAGGLATILLKNQQARATDNVIASPAVSVTSSTAYHVNPDSSASMNPTLNPIDNEKLFQLLATKPKGGVLWIGEHHNSKRDHNLEALFIQKIQSQRRRLSPRPPPMAIGLEQVQVQFQHVLDDFIAGRASEEDLKERVEWEKRWVWPFEGYLNVFTVARELGIPLVALNVNSEDLAEVEKHGYAGLKKPRLKKYITDPTGFANFATKSEYRTYVRYVIEPSYDLHRAMGLLKNMISGEKLDQEMSFRNFLSGRILWDEGMASAASAWTDANPGGIMVGLVGADHVKFKNGIPGRYARMVNGSRDCTSVILNPTLIDTRPAGTVTKVIGSDSSLYPDQITLQLRYLKDGLDEASVDVRSPSNTGGVLPLADYIVIN